MPCVHVWSKFESPVFPHLLNQAPPRAQQLRLPEFLTVPHLVHMGLTVVVVGVAQVPHRGGQVRRADEDGIHALGLGLGLGLG